MRENQHVSAPLWSALDLPGMPDFLRAIISKARNKLDLERIVIFGSRARGDHTAQSDYDLCFYLRSQRGWADFVIDVQDNAATLCGLDLVNFNEVDPELATEIARNGVCLYECEKS